MINLKMSTAVFSSDGTPDVKAAVLHEPSGGVSYTVDLGNGKPLITSELIPNGNKLQIAEALQFVSDTISVELPGRLTPFTRSWLNIAADAHYTAKEKGFWVEGVERNDGELLCLIHSEISEALEALRKGNLPDTKLPDFCSVEVELADAVIRIMDLAHARGWKVAQAVEAKIKFNKTRPHKHGKEF